MALGGTLAITGWYITSIVPETVGLATTTFRVTLVGPSNSVVVVPGITAGQVATAQTAMNTQATVTVTLT